MQALLRRYTYAEIEEYWEIGHETLRKFVDFDPKKEFGTKTPHPKTREKYRKVLLEVFPKGLILRSNPDGTPELLADLKEVLPRGEEQALAWVQKAAEILRAHRDELGDGVDAFEDWATTLLRAEYSIEKEYPPGKEG